MATLRQIKSPKIFLYIFVAIMLLILPTSSFAHPGRTDASGCHTCRTNCPNWGLSYREYHCHNSKGLPQPKKPIRSHYGENGTGSTESWPPYENSSIPTPKVATPATGISAEATSITYSLAKGMQNGQVTKLQQILAHYPEIYPEGLITGYFGLATERAVKSFQKKYNLEQVGYVGPKTRVLLNSL